VTKCSQNFATRPKGPRRDRRRWTGYGRYVSEKSRGASRGADLGLFLEAGASGNGRDEEDAVAFLETAGFAAEEADVFFVEIDV